MRFMTMKSWQKFLDSLLLVDKRLTSLSWSNRCLKWHKNCILWVLMKTTINSQFTRLHSTIGWPTCKKWFLKTTRIATISIVNLLTYTSKLFIQFNRKVLKWNSKFKTTTTISKRNQLLKNQVRETKRRTRRSLNLPPKIFKLIYIIKMNKREPLWWLETYLINTLRKCF